MRTKDSFLCDIGVTFGFAVVVEAEWVLVIRDYTNTFPGALVCSKSTYLKKILEHKLPKNWMPRKGFFQSRYKMVAEFLPYRGALSFTKRQINDSCRRVLMPASEQASKEIWKTVNSREYVKNAYKKACEKCLIFFTQKISFKVFNLFCCQFRFHL